MGPQRPFLLEHWRLTNVVHGPVLQHGAGRTTFAIRADQGQFVVKTSDDDAALGLVRPSDIEIDQHLSVFGYLADTDFGHAPLLLRTRSGGRFLRSNGQTIYVLERITGNTPPATPAVWSGLGRIAARLNIRTDYPYAFGIPIAAVITELARSAKDYPFSREFLRLVATLDVLANQPSSLIHGEINPANAIISPGGRLTLLDWDQAGIGPWVLEAGYPLLTHFLSEDLSFDHASASAFYRSYTAGIGISAANRRLVFTAALLHALRYLPFGDPLARWTRIQFALKYRDELLHAINANHMSDHRR